MVYFAKKFRHYLLGRTFKARMDHTALSWLWTFKEPIGQIARWQAYLSEFDMDIIHRKGASHGNADTMSRRPADSAELSVESEEINSDAEFCQAIHESICIDWKKFQSDDPDLKQVYSLKINDDEKPYVKEEYSTVDKRIPGQCENIVIENDVLSRKFEDSTGFHYQFIVPSSLQRKILRELHSGVGGGHLGAKKMSVKVKNRY